MDDALPRHLWILGGLRTDRSALAATLELPPALLPPVDAHLNLRGPYTAAGTLARALVPEALHRDPATVRRYDIELLSIAPELSSILPNSRETLTSMAIPTERTRFYARLRTRRISHGLVEFLHSCLRADSPRTLVVENVDHAEHTDLEFLAALVRRTDPARLRVVLCSAGDTLPDEQLLADLRAHTEQLSAVRAESSWSGTDAAWAYVSTDGTSDLPALLDAYADLDPAARAALHDRRAAELTALDQQSLRLGAIPYHLEHGSDPAGAGVKALYAAQDYCVCIGFYQATVGYGQRGLALIDPRESEHQWWAVALELGLALSILSRTHEAMRLYDEARLVSTRPAVHMAAAYSTAMLYTRHNEPEERDEKLAKSWLNSAIATASLLEDRSERAFQSAFYRNGKALVEVNLGDLDEALRLVNECVASLDELLTPDEHRLHRSVLKNNRARVYLGLGRLDEALADYAVVIEQDPNHAEHYLERGNILRRLGRPEEAAADYRRAIQLSPPFPEIYYNRADLLLGEGDTEGALADFSYVLELEPDFVDAYVNRAGIHLEAGDLAAAEQDAVDGLRRDPENPYLHAVLGQVRAEREEFKAAQESFDRAVTADPGMITALAGRATVAYRTGNLTAALADLAHAVELEPDDPALRYNRAFVYQDTGRWDEALADLTTASALAPEDEDIASALEICRRMVASAR
ncbi:tetratricopeptide repeat protein [Kitasatospora sp. MAP5-34]|uniref:tetratricopeptide repeat protein n=1 Tax=Kitasatospora sp. MAP5-34 TaxID=3035102 RepID=UPI002474801A|nr:tetratricopeptide repeat protein [Kitasatospora sp. MAP5-34]MDH6574488.1 tetratricopeptide (TPR) repeat protein [Kitasatospora sp. MAP5-34]